MPDAPLTCPRCRYDLSGAVSAWAGACPLRGTCSECGAAFNWGDVFNPDRRILRGFFEDARGLRVASWSLTTLAWTALPWVFWGRVRDRPLRLPRGVLWPLAAATPFYVLGSVLFMAANAVWVYAVMPPPRTYEWWAAVNCWTGPVASLVPFPPPGVSVHIIPGRWMLLAGAATTMSVAFPLVLLALNRLPPSPALPAPMILRAAVYSFAWVPMAMIFRLAHAGWYLDVTIGWARSPAIPTHAPVLNALAYTGGAALLLWIVIWWLSALVAMAGRRNAFRFWIAGVIPSAAAGAWVVARIQDFLVASR